MPRAVSTTGTYPPVGGRGRFFHCLVTAGPMVYETWRSKEPPFPSIPKPSETKEPPIPGICKKIRIKEPLGFTKEPAILYAAFDFVPQQIENFGR